MKENKKNNESLELKSLLRIFAKPLIKDFYAASVEASEGKYFFKGKSLDYNEVIVNLHEMTPLGREIISSWDYGKNL